MTFIPRNLINRFVSDNFSDIFSYLDSRLTISTMFMASLKEIQAFECKVGCILPPGSHMRRITIS